MTAFLIAALVALTSGGIHAVDFGNLQYPNDLIRDTGFNGPLVLHKGTFSHEDKANYIQIQCGHQKIAYGDLIGNGQDEAAVTLWCNTGGTGYFTQAYVYQMKNGKPALMASVSGGDRGYHGIYKLQIKGRRLVVTRGNAEAASSSGDCCPFTETSYKWNGKAFVSTSVRNFTGDAAQFGD